MYDSLKVILFAYVYFTGGNLIFYRTIQFMSLSWQKRGTQQYYSSLQYVSYLISLYSFPNTFSDIRGSEVASEVENIMVFCMEDILPAH